MGNSIHVNVSGGSLSMANVSQGDGNTLGAQVNISQATQAIESSSAELMKLGGALKIPEEQLQSLRAALAEIRTELQKPSPSATTAAGPLKVIRENFSWAYPLLKDAISVAWPALLAAIAA